MSKISIEIKPIIVEPKEMHDKNGSFLKIRDFSMNRLLILNL